MSRQTQNETLLALRKAVAEGMSLRRELKGWQLDQKVKDPSYDLLGPMVARAVEIYKQHISYNSKGAGNVADTESFAGYAKRVKSPDTNVILLLCKKDEIANGIIKNKIREMLKGKTYGEDMIRELDRRDYFNPEYAIGGASAAAAAAGGGGARAAHTIQDGVVDAAVNAVKTYYNSSPASAADDGGAAAVDDPVRGVGGGAAAAAAGGGGGSAAQAPLAVQSFAANKAALTKMQAERKPAEDLVRKLGVKLSQLEQKHLQLAGGGGSAAQAAAYAATDKTIDRLRAQLHLLDLKNTLFSQLDALAEDFAQIKLMEAEGTKPAEDLVRKLGVKMFQLKQQHLDLNAEFWSASHAAEGAAAAPSAPPVPAPMAVPVVVPQVLTGIPVGEDLQGGGAAQEDGIAPKLDDGPPKLGGQ